MTVPKGKCSLDDVGQLANIARPLIFQEPIQRLLLDSCDSAPEILVEHADEVVYEKLNVLGPFTKRRNRDQRCLKPVVQVLTQPTVGHRRLWIAVGGS